MGEYRKMREATMKAREAIFDFQYAEKMKSGLMIGTVLLEELTSLKEEELTGGKKVLISYLEGLRGEIRIAENVLGSGHYSDLDGKVMEVIGRIQMLQFSEAQRSFSEAISLATTFCQSSMTFLMEKELI